MGFQILGQSKTTGSRVKHDRIAVFDVFIGGGRDSTLFSAMLLSALEKRSIEPAAMGEDRATKGALQEILTFEVV